MADVDIASSSAMMPRVPDNSDGTAPAPGMVARSLKLTTDPGGAPLVPRTASRSVSDVRRRFEASSAGLLVPGVDKTLRDGDGERVDECLLAGVWGEEGVLPSGVAADRQTLPP